ncbi:MAG TPA: hypothetical protein VFF04_00235 [Candidatus Babeliales bacterium]|nr:hypothetical protein [Candidatus Babeliales bacterium]
MDSQFSIKEAIKFGFSAIIDNIGLFVGLAVTYIAVLVVALVGAIFLIGMPHVMRLMSFMPELAQGCHNAQECDVMKQSFMGIFQGFSLAWIIGIILLLWLLLIAMQLGYAQIALDVHDTGKSSVSRIFSSFWALPKVIIATILSLLVIIPGLILLIIPGIYLTIRLYFFWFFILDKNAGIFESLKLSWQATRGQVWHLFLLLLVLALFGLAVKMVAFFFLLPFTLIVYVYVYRRLTSTSSY